MERFKFSMRHHQIKQEGENVIVECGAIGTPTKYVSGNVPEPNWIDFTKFVDGLDELKLDWSAVNHGNASSKADKLTGSNYSKGLSLDLDFFGDAFQFIWDWLLTEQCQILNSVEVKIDDLLCERSYGIFEIKPDNIKYCPDEDKCFLNIQLREQDLTWHCIHKTFIWDDWQGWFNSEGTSTKEHPTFLTCIEPRPRLLNSVRMGFFLFYKSFPGVNIISELSGAEPEDKARRILQVHYFQPAPLIRDYIDNVAGKCGLSVDTIFHDPNSPYYNLCLYYPSNGQFYEDDSGGNSQNKYLFDNRWNITIAELLDYLRPVFSAEWYVTPDNTIVFKPRYEFENLPAIWDLRNTDLYYYDLCFDFSGNKKAAYGRYEYQPDGSDLASQEISNLYNDIVDYDGDAINPMLEGERSNNVQFAPTAFVRDGRVKDYLERVIDDGRIGALILLLILVVVSAALFVGVTVGASIAVGLSVTLWVTGILGTSNNWKNRIAENPRYHGAVRLTSEQTMLPRLLLWDGEEMNWAKVERTQNPSPNTYFNSENKPYQELNKISEDNSNLYIYNYPMYFDSKFEGNLYDRFHDAIDNPMVTREANQTFSFKTDLCCDTIDLLGLWDGDSVKIGRLIRLENRNTYQVYGRIEDISVDYKKDIVTVKGKVIYK